MTDDFKTDVYKRQAFNKVNIFKSYKNIIY